MSKIGHNKPIVLKDLSYSLDMFTILFNLEWFFHHPTKEARNFHY